LTVWIQPNSPHGSAERSGLTRYNLAEAERIRYMERILHHFVPNLSFDIQSLRKTADELKQKHRSSDSDAGPSIRLENEDFEDLAIDDEDFTIKALPDNTTRTSLSSLRRNRHFKTKAHANRIFRRIFLSEFLDENPQEDR
jgi:hypothetical protein